MSPVTTPLDCHSDTEVNLQDCLSDNTNVLSQGFAIVTDPSGSQCTDEFIIQPNPTDSAPVSSANLPCSQDLQTNDLDVVDSQNHNSSSLSDSLTSDKVNLHDRTDMQFDTLSGYFALSGTNPTRNCYNIQQIFVTNKYDRHCSFQNSRDVCTRTRRSWTSSTMARHRPSFPHPSISRLWPRLSMCTGKASVVLS